MVQMRHFIREDRTQYSERLPLPCLGVGGALVRGFLSGPREEKTVFRRAYSGQETFGFTRNVRAAALAPRRMILLSLLRPCATFNVKE